MTGAKMVRYLSIGFY